MCRSNRVSTVLIKVTRMYIKRPPTPPRHIERFTSRLLLERERECSQFKNTTAPAAAAHCDQVAAVAVAAGAAGHRLCSSCFFWLRASRTLRRFVVALRPPRVCVDCNATVPVVVLLMALLSEQQRTECSRANQIDTKKGIHQHNEPHSRTNTRSTHTQRDRA